MVNASTSQTRQLGQQGEQAASSYLAQAGYAIVATNWRAGRLGEIDIIATTPLPKDKGRSPALVFIEVKTRRNNTQGHPLEAIDARKQQQLLKVAEHFLLKHPEYAETFCLRFDAIGIEWPNPKQPPSIHHLENIMN